VYARSKIGALDIIYNKPDVGIKAGMTLGAFYQGILAK
jgi:hypothetical protein